MKILLMHLKNMRKKIIKSTKWRELFKNMTEYINHKKEKNYFNNIFQDSNDKSYNIAEIGINHNGDLELAKELIKISYDAGFDCVKFQKRVPELCVPQDKREDIRITPWGKMTYFQHPQ